VHLPGGRQLNNENKICKSQRGGVNAVDLFLLRATSRSIKSPGSGGAILAKNINSAKELPEWVYASESGNPHSEIEFYIGTFGI